MSKITIFGLKHEPTLPGLAPSPLSRPLRKGLDRRMKENPVIFRDWNSSQTVRGKSPAKGISSWTAHRDRSPG